MLNETQLKKLFPKARQAIIAAMVEGMSDLDRFGITKTPNRLAYFLAQLAHESNGFTLFTEGLNYSSKRLCEVFPHRFPNIASAQSFANNPKALANHIYANRMGNGKPATGDGYAYRGRGAVQLTGRDTYRAIGEIIGLPLEDNPDLAGQPENLMLCAAGFWQWKNINAQADVSNFDKVTRLVNGGTNGAADRKQWLSRIMPVVSEAHADAPINVTLSVQKALISRGYHEVGVPDGQGGSRTRGAILAFEADNNLPLRGLATQDILDSIKAAPDRVISDARATGVPEASPVIASTDKTIAVGALGGVGGAVAIVTPALEQIETISNLYTRLKAAIAPLLPSHLPEVGIVPIIVCLCSGAIVYYAIKARSAHINDFRTGKLGK